MKDEAKDDAKVRIAEFVKRHEANVKELEVDFANIPVPTQIMQGVWATQIQAMPIDLKGQSKPSPFADNKVLS